MGWVAFRPRCIGKIIFLDIADSSGRIQVVVDMRHLSQSCDWATIRSLRPESSIYVHGTVALGGTGEQSAKTVEVHASAIDVISIATGRIDPSPRLENLVVLEPQHTDKVLANRHLYLRNPTLLAIGNLRSKMFHSIRNWFHSRLFVDISAPLITPSILYEPTSAITLSGLLDDTKPLFLSQCAGFYLEAAAHAHERVYNLGPSFRNESRTNRHLMEYWHIKAELASGTLDGVMSLVEVFLRDIRDHCGSLGSHTASLLGNSFPGAFTLPFPRITYIEAYKYLSTTMQPIEFGQNISTQQERMLTDRFCSHKGSPLWITHKPRVLEPFPYAIHSIDSRLSMTADLISPNGFGEICGVAEKSYHLSDLDERLKEKGKTGLEEYAWVRDMRKYGMVPHVAFGMGFERLIRWWIGVSNGLRAGCTRT
jgi:asparaginyl-tRNA synthetase